MSPLVLKIGGSLGGSAHLRRLLDQVVATPRQIVVVPGGGAYADAVRAEQAVLGFDDREAHRRAIFAMHRMADDFRALQPNLVPASSREAIEAAWQTGAVPAWLPWPMVEHETSVPQDWSMTSDGLAAWLASRLEGAGVALIKSCRVPPGAALDELAADGITDPQFPKIVTSAGLLWHVLGAGDEARLEALLQPV